MIDNNEVNDVKYLKGIISFKQSADLTNTIVYRTNDGNLHNYIIPDVKRWEKKDNGHVWIECERTTYDFADVALKDIAQMKKFENEYGDGEKMAVARVGARYGNEVNIMYVSGMIEIDKKTNEITELRPHMFDLCNPNHYVIGKYQSHENGTDKNEILKINARDINQIIVGRDDFVIKANDKVFATRGLAYELEIARAELDQERGYAIRSQTDVLIQMSYNIGKPVVILTSDSLVTFSGTNDVIDVSVTGKELIGQKIDISGERIDLRTDDLIKYPESTEVLDITHDSNAAYDMTIIEGDECMYVSFDIYRQPPVLELARDDGEDDKPKTNTEEEYELYRCISLETRNRTTDRNTSEPEWEENYPSPTPYFQDKEIYQSQTQKPDIEFDFGREM